jgi:hypothetical protein
MDMLLIITTFAGYFLVALILWRKRRLLPLNPQCVRLEPTEKILRLVKRL